MLFWFQVNNKAKSLERTQKSIRCNDSYNNVVVAISYKSTMHIEED